MKALTLFRLALRNLRGGGQRALFAGLCIAFGVMSVVSMSLLAEAMRAVLIVHPRLTVGGDLRFEHMQDNFLSASHLAQVDGWQQQGLVDAYTPVALNRYLTLRLPGSGELQFITHGMGVDPSVYPLVGTLEIEGGGTLLELLQNPGDILLTRDLAEENGLSAGDRVILADLSLGAPLDATLRGIISDSPDHQGGVIYYDFTTAQLLRGSPLVVNRILALSSEFQPVYELAGQQGWSILSTEMLAENNRQAQELFDIGLRGAGVLGLLVGGIGVANTMQVLLRRRLQDAAILKVLGYRQSHLQALFLIEAFLLGAAGSLLGLVVGLGVSFYLVTLFNRLANLLVTWLFTPAPLLAGLLTGIATSLIFAWIAIEGASRVHPSALLRRESIKMEQVGRLRSLGMGLVLTLLFAGVSSLVMGSLIKGLGVVGFAYAGLLVFGGLMGGLGWLGVRLLPLGRLPLLNQARRRLLRSGAGQVFAMIALFTGVVALGLAAVVTQSAEREYSLRSPELEGFNLILIGPPSQASEMERAATGLNPRQAASGSETYTRSIEPLGDISESEGSPPGDRTIAPLLIGRSQPHDFLIQGAAWGSLPDGVYTHQYADVPPGSQVRLTLLDGSTHDLPVVGTYSFDYTITNFRFQSGLLLPLELSQRLAVPDALTLFIDLPPAQLDEASTSLAAGLPGVTVINLADYIARFSQTYRNLFIFAVSLAGLALLAGAVLIGNSVSLALIERRYELGVYKAVGYSGRHILTGLLFEYLISSLLAIGFGLLAVQATLLVIGFLNEPAAHMLYLEPLTALFICLSSAGLVFLTVLALTWRPAQVSPLVVLDERG